VSAPRISTGRLYAVETPCPGCGRLEVIAVDLTAVLTTPSEGQATLKVKAASKALDHWCGVEATVHTLFDTNADDPAP
jgi:hypothetical protein